MKSVKRRIEVVVGANTIFGAEFVWVAVKWMVTIKRMFQGDGDHKEDVSE